MIRIAQLGQQAEIQYAGVMWHHGPDGIESADTEHMPFDTRTLERRVMPFHLKQRF